MTKFSAAVHEFAMEHCEAFTEKKTMRTNIYLASRWSNQVRLRQIRDELHEKTQWRVVSRWIDTKRPENPDPKFFMSLEGNMRMQMDLSDLQRCDIVVADMLQGMGRRSGMML